MGEYEEIVGCDEPFRKVKRAAVVLKACDQRGFQDIEKVMRILASERNSAGDARFGPPPQAQKWRLPGENREKKTARLELKSLKIRTQTTCARAHAVRVALYEVTSGAIPCDAISSKSSSSICHWRDLAHAASTRL